MTINPGIYKNLDIDVYHADEAISSTKIRTFIKCPALYKFEYLTDWLYKKPVSRCATIGSMAHIMLLEPDKFNEKYIVASEDIQDKRLKPWKEFSKKAKDGGKEPLTHLEYVYLEAMRDAIISHPFANDIFKYGMPETSFFAEHKETGLMIKGRPDYLIDLPDYGLTMVDYKTVSGSLEFALLNANAARSGYHIQAAHHIKAIKGATKKDVQTVLYILQMQEAPFLIRVAPLDAESLQVGHSQIDDAMFQLAECLKTDKWSGYDDLEPFALPAWYGIE